MDKLTKRGLIWTLVWTLAFGFVWGMIVGTPIFRRNNDGWCIHTTHLMLCNEPDYADIR